MRLKNKIVLGIDTSCYTTSIAAINLQGDLVADKAIMLKVKPEEKGLRQSEAVFQHVNNMGDAFDEFKEKLKDCEIKAVCVSSKPRSVVNSYMPVFTAGLNFARVIAGSLNVDLYQTSHQDGHIEAALYKSDLNKDKFIAIHLSGGTTEVLLVEKIDLGYTVNIIGQTKDISMGQLIDRVGVRLKHNFPCGKYIDEQALSYVSEVEKLKISVDGCFMNLSGLETQIYRLIDTKDKDYISKLTMENIGRILEKVLINATKTYSINDVLFVGGVSSSIYLRQNLSHKLKKSGINTFWTDAKCAKDNAIGCASLGLKTYLGGINNEN